MENRVFVWNTFQPPNALDQPLDEHPLDYPEVNDKVEDQNIYIGNEIKPGYGTASILDVSSDPNIRKSTQLRKVSVIVSLIMNNNLINSMYCNP